MAQPLGDLMRHIYRIPALVLCVASALFTPPTTSAQSAPVPKIEFDVPGVIGCSEVTTPEFASTHSLEKLLEVRIKTSSLLETGPDRFIRELFFFIYSPEQSMQIVDFSPKTSLITEYAGPIEESVNRDNSSNAGFNFTPTLEMAGKANINASVSDRLGNSRRTTKLPPKQLSVSSGTQKRGTAVFFKFKPSSQSALEGSHELVLSLKVPISWRADILHVHCRGVTATDSRGPAVTSRNDFLVPIHLAADAPAKLNCHKLLTCERKVRQLSSASHFSKRKKTDLVKKVSLFVKHDLLGKAEKSQPVSWGGQVIFNNRSWSKVESLNQIRLDPSAKQAIADFRSARKRVVDLNH